MLTSRNQENQARRKINLKAGRLVLKVGAVVLLMRNLNTLCDLINGNLNANQIPSQ